MLGSSGLKRVTERSVPISSSHLSTQPHTGGSFPTERDDRSHIIWLKYWRRNQWPANPSLYTTLLQECREPPGQKRGLCKPWKNSYSESNQNAKTIYVVTELIIYINVYIMYILYIWYIHMYTYKSICIYNLYMYVIYAYTYIPYIYNVIHFR